MGKLAILLVMLAAVAVGAVDPPKIELRLMPFNYSAPRMKDDTVTHIMVHFSSACDLHPKTPYDVEENIGKYLQYGVSTHYLIDREGVLYVVTPEERIAWHAGRGKLPFEPYYENMFNHHSIGIELLGIGTAEELAVLGVNQETYDQIPKELLGFADAQYPTLTWLLDQLYGRYNIPKDRYHVVAHSEYAPTRRPDPGVLFDWTRIGLPMKPEDKKQTQ
eukprot:TRINITY_DN2573_c0_g2_i1.p1 TRINITY_DN2573_c0_g2~~TRINITY_DN2573_c0_g2_i1.p1  ORF type:complete len:251 (+),score=68.89 TRINITY_DN2573_c0_g2_i1:99-755(+)